MKELIEVRDKLLAERARLVEAAAPHHAKYETLRKKVAELEVEMNLAADKFKAIERPRLSEIDNQLGQIAIALGGRRLSEGNQ